MVRNLIYHIHALKSSHWKWHIEQLLERKRFFNGKKVLSVSHSEHCVDPKEVEAFTSDLKVDSFFVFKNNELAETQTFKNALSQVKSLDDSEITFYGHTKGVTRDREALVVSRQISTCMWKLNFINPELVDKVMSQYDSAGCFINQISLCYSPWHYSGTFFWFKHSAIFNGPWERIYQSYYGVEGWIGAIVPIHRAFEWVGRGNGDFTKINEETFYSGHDTQGDGSISSRCRNGS